MRCGGSAGKKAADGLSAADGGSRAEGRAPANRAGREEDDDRRAHVEAADLGASLQVGAVELPPAGRARIRKIGDRAGPGGLDAADEEGPDHDECEGAPARVTEVKDHALVAGEEMPDPFRGGRIDAEAITGEVNQRREGPVDGEVDPVVVAGSEVDGGGGAPGEGGGGFPVASEEGFERVGERLRLDEAAPARSPACCTVPSEGAATASGSAGRGRASGRSALVKKALKVGQERGSDSTASERSTS